MPKLSVIHLPPCEIQIDHERKLLKTLFPDGAVCEACPHDTDDYRATALRLGFGDDTWRLCCSHEVAHTLLMQALGWEFSPVLCDIAHDRTLNASQIAFHHSEEDLVLRFQHFANGGPPVGSIPEVLWWDGRGLDWDSLAKSLHFALKSSLERSLIVSWLVDCESLRAKWL